MKKQYYFVPISIERVDVDGIDDQLNATSRLVLHFTQPLETLRDLARLEIFLTELFRREESDERSERVNVQVVGQPFAVEEQEPTVLEQFFFQGRDGVAKEVTVPRWNSLPYY